ncbi:serine dehydratase alpha chain-domain-containing protein [Polychytrium aggregatum]|uniref:serine dehydratase alpha chain-domain-containing protein n=1 Tax=Polychytrium aggregatum TaxID=110093 RepID=UPI0022FDFFCB|nr:serine dehydratase alpha chain-domain-containing protein [Polychytrium aggregatum]KAI9202814.1 serine dehydratase alpha chain-domain-containing protein [Polychytrium aggregatum]
MSWRLVSFLRPRMVSGPSQWLLHSARPLARIGTTSLSRMSFVTSTGAAVGAGAVSSSATQPSTSAHAVVSTFDLFSIGIGPSSSHTVGPMRAAKMFVDDLSHCNALETVTKIRVDLYGSLALTGVGHGTPLAILMGLEGESPDMVDAKSITRRVKNIYNKNTLHLGGTHRVAFHPHQELVFHYRESLPQHPNGMRFTAFDKNGDMVATNEFFSIGGGFVVNERTKIAANFFYKDMNGEEHYAETSGSENSSVLSRVQSKHVVAALPFHNAESLLKICEAQNLTIAQVVYKNELQWRSSEEIQKQTLEIWNVMNQSINNGILAPEETLPNQLNVRRRAPALHQKLMRGFAEYVGVNSSAVPTGNGTLGSAAVENISNQVRPRGQNTFKRSLPALDWISLYAIAVNEENAAGGRVVTAPTNGAAGTIPAVLKYYLEFICPSPAQAEKDIIEFLLTAAAIGMLYKRGASISAAEMGCQGEVGVACSMAAAAFTAVMGGTAQQVENAAEIGMEHNLGLTCDPPQGLVVIPCIERNALAAVKAVTAAQLALNGDGHHRVTLDQVIATMRETGHDMMSKYKETSEGGLAVNVPVC